MGSRYFYNYEYSNTDKRVDRVDMWRQINHEHFLSLLESQYYQSNILYLYKHQPDMKHSSFVRNRICLFHLYGFKFNEFGDIWYFADL